MDKHEIYRECIADIEFITSLFDGGRCRDVRLARERLKNLKAKWNALVRRFKGTEIEGVIEQALTRLPSASTRPDSWHSYLYDAEGDFTFHLTHRKEVHGQES